MTTTNTTLPDGWIETTLGEVCEFISRGVTPKYSNEGILVYNQKCIRDGKILKKDSRFLDSSQKIMEEKFLKDLDILICSTGVGTLGRVGQIKEVIIPSTVDSHVSIVRVNNKNSKFYIGYLLKSREKYIESLAEGSTGQTELPREKIKNISLSLPPLPEQQAIAKILSFFDDKIEILREQNETLEKMAQTIFDEWFGKYSVDDELPEGWRVGKLGEIVEIKNGFAFKSEDYVENGVPIVRTTNFESGTINLNDPVFLTDEKSKEFNNYFLEKFDFLLVMVGASIGKNVITPSHILPALQNQNMWNFKSLESVFKMYTIFLAKAIVKQQLNSASGSAREFFRKDYFYNLDIIIPNYNFIKDFSDKITPFFEKIDSNLEQIQTLSKTLDELLPKLVKGEVRVF